MKDNHHRISFNVGNSIYDAQVLNYVRPKKYDYLDTLDSYNPKDMTKQEKEDIKKVTDATIDLEEEQIEELIEMKKVELKRHRGE